MNRDRWVGNQTSRFGLIPIVLMGLTQGCAGLQLNKFDSLSSAPNSSPVSVSIEVEKFASPIKRQQTLIAIVKDAQGKPVYDTMVEWILARANNTVGDIIEVGQDPLSSMFGRQVLKIDNTYARNKTNHRGESRITITSVQEGTTHLIAVVPDIKNKNQHNAFAVMNWLDAEWEFPNDNVQKVGTSRTLMTMVRKASTGAPLPGYQVKWNVTSGPEAYFDESGKAEAIAKTDKNGVARVTLSQRIPGPGNNTISINLIKPKELGRDCCPTVSNTIANGVSATTWMAPSIALEQQCPSVLILGKATEFLITLTNTSKVDATNVRLQTIIPAGLEFIGAKPQAQLSHNILTWDLTDLPAQTSRQVSIRIKAGMNGTHVQEALLKADNGLQSQSMCSVFVGEPSLSISQTCTSDVLVNDESEFNISVTNTGTVEASNVQIVDVVPSGMSHTSGQPEIVRDIGILPAGSTVTEVFTLKADQVGNVTNVARVTSGTNLSKQTRCDLAIKKPSIAITKTGATLLLEVTDKPDPVEVGTQTTYSIVVTNQGTANATNIKISSTVPDGMEYVSSTGSTGRLVVVGKLVSFNSVPMLKPKENLTLTVTVKGTETGDHRFRTEMNADQLASPVLEEESTKFYR